MKSIGVYTTLAMYPDTYFDFPFYGYCLNKKTGQHQVLIKFLGLWFVWINLPFYDLTFKIPRKKMLTA